MKKIICCALTIAMLACCAGVFAAESIEISECEQNISESCIDVTVSGTADGEILAVIACDKPMDIFSGFAQAAENIVAIAQKATDVTETAVKLFYDENDIEADKIYVYASVDGISITERTIDFYSRTARILMNFKNAASWNEYAGTDGYVNDYKEAFGMFELTDAVSKQLSALSENELNNVYKKMYQKRSTFDTVEKIEKAYSDAIVEVYSERGSGTGGSGSGGGGGGGGYPVTGATISTTPDNAGQNQNAVKGFEDLEMVEWARTAINVLYARGIINGISPTQFDPEGYVTREDFVKIFIGAAGYDFVDNGVEFFDVPDGTYFEKYVKTAAALNIVQGVENGIFGTGGYITRQDLAVMLYRALYNGKTGSDAVSFADENEISDYALTAVKVLCEDGIISGMPDGSFKPLERATRAQAAQLIYRLIQSGKL